MAILADTAKPYCTTLLPLFLQLCHSHLLYDKASIINITYLPADLSDHFAGSLQERCILALSNPEKTGGQGGATRQKRLNDNEALTNYTVLFVPVIFTSRYSLAD